VISQTRYVTHIDILGFKALTGKDPQEAWKVLSSLASVRSYIQGIEVELLDVGERKRIPERVFSVMFSDTIVLFTKEDSLLDLKLIILATTELFHKALFNCVPVRAGIAHGEFFFNISESMYAGPALIEAYTIGEEAQWLGIVTSEHVYRQAQIADLKSGTSDVVIPATIPLDSGPQNGFSINWPTVFRQDFTIAPPISTECFYRGFEDAFGAYKDLPKRSQAKYENTAVFVNALLKLTI